MLQGLASCKQQWQQKTPLDQEQAHTGDPTADDWLEEVMERTRRDEIPHTCKYINYTEQSKLSVLLSAIKGQCTTMDFGNICRWIQSEAKELERSTKKTTRNVLTSSLACKRRDFLFLDHILFMCFPKTSSRGQ